MLVVDTATDEDRIGAIGLDAARRSRVAVDSPVVYAYVSHARWRGEILLQLNYVFWFPSRPSDGAYDLLAGHLDGITWRVTLAPDGSVLVADTIHNCGCYHLFFPSPALLPVAYGAAAEEQPFVPQRLPVLNPGERFTLHIAARTHYLQRVTATAGETGAGHAYDVQRYDVLRSLDTGRGVQASLFGPDGVVARHRTRGALPVLADGGARPRRDAPAWSPCDRFRGSPAFRRSVVAGAELRPCRTMTGFRYHPGSTAPAGASYPTTS